MQKFQIFRRNMFRMAACLHRSGFHPRLQKWAATYTALPAKEQQYLYDLLSHDDGSNRKVIEKAFSSFGVCLKFPYLGSLLRDGCLRKMEYLDEEARDTMADAVRTALDGKRHNSLDAAGYKGCLWVDMMVPAGDTMISITRESATSGIFVRYDDMRRQGLLLDIDTYISR